MKALIIEDGYIEKPIDPERISRIKRLTGETG
jgi:hypothetical protein